MTTQTQKDYTLEQLIDIITDFYSNWNKTQINMKTQIKNYCEVNNITEFELGTDEWVDFITHLGSMNNLNELDFDEIENILEEIDIEVY